MRPVDKDTLITSLAWHDQQGMISTIDDILDIIEAFPTLTPQNEWVSVEERLPGASGNYICAAKDKIGCAWTIPGEWNVEMKTWFGEFGEIKNVVTHWMPLPAPPDRYPPERQEGT